MNAAASVLFLIGGLIYWEEVTTLFVSSRVAGYLAGHYGRRLNPAKARVAISCVNTLIVAYVFWRRWG